MYSGFVKNKFSLISTRIFIISTCRTALGLQEELRKQGNKLCFLLIQGSLLFLKSLSMIHPTKSCTLQPCPFGVETARSTSKRLELRLYTVTRL
jgi:hypothetical protein